MEHIVEMKARIECATCKQCLEFNDNIENYYDYDNLNKVFRLNIANLISENVVDNFCINQKATLMKYECEP